MSEQAMALSPVEALKAGFRRACVRRMVGDEEGAITVLKKEIPKLVVAWAKSTNLEVGEKKAKLKEMFDDESSRADELATAFDLFAGRFEKRVASLVTREIKTACSRIEKVAKSLDEFERNLKKYPYKPDIIQQSDLIDERPIEENPLIEEQEIPAIFEDEKIQKVSVNAKTPMQNLDDKLPEEELAEIDQPLGLGLKFDEIEEMIDEVLSLEN